MSKDPAPWVLVVANGSDSDAGYVGERLDQLGYELRTVQRDDGELPTGLPEDSPPALLLILGSEWSVHDPVDPTALVAECRLVLAAHDADVPILGLCYGAQLLAHAFGGRVRPALRAEAGLVRVDSDDPSLVPPGPWTAFHTDVLDVPPGATEIARNDCGVQAFVLPGALAVQFHPEVRPDVLADWAGRFPDLVAAAGTTPEELVTVARGREAESRQAAHRLVDAFLDRVATSTDPRGR